MRTLITLLLFLLPVLAFSQATTGDLIFTKRTSTGSTPLFITPSTSTNVLALNGSGGITTVSRSISINGSSISLGGSVTTAVLGANSFTAAQSVGLTSLGTTTAAGLTLSNSTAAAVGAQQVSPALIFTAQGWKTTATAASQTVDYRTYLLPVQGSTSPTTALNWDKRINGGSWSTMMQIQDDLVSYPFHLSLGGTLGSSNSGVITSGIGGIMLGRGDTAYNQFYVGFQGGYFCSFAADSPFGFSSTSAGNAADIRNLDTYWSRESAAVFQFGADQSSPVSYTLKGGDATGTNGTGGNVTFTAGRGTGSGAGGTVAIQTAPAGSSGTTPGTLRTIISIKPDGTILLNTATLPTSATGLASGTIYSDAGTLKVAP